MQNIKNSYNKDALVLNRTHKDNNFCSELFRVPEILNRLKQYRDILNENDLTIPLWVYNLTQDIKIFTSGQKSYMLSFLINLGFFDRYTTRKGWPKYIIGTDPLISVLVGEISFEEQILLFSQGYCQESLKLQTYQAHSYYNTKTESFYLTNVKKRELGDSLKEIIHSFKSQEDNEDFDFQLLSPHEQTLMNDFNSQGLFPRDFLAADSSLKWLWPIWKRSQIHYSRGHSSHMTY